jgi:hypothetical protein
MNRLVLLTTGIFVLSVFCVGSVVGASGDDYRAGWRGPAKRSRAMKLTRKARSISTVLQRSRGAGSIVHGRLPGASG